MAKSTKASLRRILSSFLLVLSIFSWRSGWSSEYIDQIVFETPNAVKSIYDVRIHSFIENLYLRNKIVNVSSEQWLKTDFESDRQSFIEQYLVGLHATEEESSLKPTLSDVQNAKSKIDSVFKSMDQKSKIYSDLGIKEDDIHEWLEDRLTLEKFLQTTMMNRIVITDQKIQEHYQTWKKDRFGNQSFPDSQQKVKDDLSMSLLDEEFQKWVDQEKRRRKLVVKSLKL